MSLLLLLSQQSASASTVALVGQSFSYAQGVPSISVGSPLFGQASGISQGLLGKALSTLFTGQSWAFSQGALGLSAASPIYGQTYTVGQGTLTLSSKSSLAGISFATVQGGVTLSMSTPVGGQSLSIGQGALSMSQHTLLTGQSYSQSVGVLTPTLVGKLPGQIVTFILGRFPIPAWPQPSQVSAGVQYGPTGIEFTGSSATGPGATVIAYRSDVQVSIPKLHIASLKKHRTQPQERREPAVIRARAGIKNAYATSSVSGISVVTQPESLNVTSSAGRLDAFTSTDVIYVTTTTESTEI